MMHLAKRGLLAQLSLVIYIIALSPIVKAQSADDEPLFEQLSSHFKKKYLSIGTLLQTVGDFQIDRSFSGNNGFNISNFRVNLSGELDKGFGYFLQTNFTSSTTILDAKLYYKISPAVTVDVGLFKSPFSAEFLTGAANIDFVNRSQVVAALAPGRQIGAQVRGSAADKVVSYSLGLFNGNGFDGNNNDNDSFLYAGRVAVYPSISDHEERLAVGFNFAFSNDENATLGSGFVQHFDGDRVLIGGDVRWTHENYLLSGEIIHANLDPSAGPSSDVFGFHTTAGYMLDAKSQLLFRIDSFGPDSDLGDDSHLLILGYNRWPTHTTEVQLNYIVNTDDTDLDNHQILVNAQISF